MIIVFLCTWIVGWSLGMLLRRAIPRARPATASAPAEQRRASSSPAPGLEDDPARWPTAQSEWTALDDRQLIRLLTDSAS
jgi:hypothetical protein